MFDSVQGRESIINPRKLTRICFYNKELSWDSSLGLYSDPNRVKILYTNLGSYLTHLMIRVNIKEIITK